jgi:hypothetical protein
MIPSRRVAILFVTTLLSTRHLLAQSEQQFRTPPLTDVHGAAYGSGQARAGVDTRISQSRSITTNHDKCSAAAATLLEPAEGSRTAAPVRFRWMSVANAYKYQLTYTYTAAGKKKEVKTDLTATQHMAALPDGPVTWKVRVYASPDDDDDEECKSSVSRDVHFTVATASVCDVPTVNVTPASASKTAGQTVTINSNASGTAPIDVRWYEGPAGNKSKPVGTGTTFTSAPLSATTSFWAEATNTCGNASSNTVTVTVAAACTPPSITQQPAGTTVQEGGSATLTVTATGTAPFTYQWYRGNAPVAPSSNGNSNSFNTGALTQTTAYRVEVRNGCGSVTSNEATVTVTRTCAAPSIVQQPADVTIASGAGATLSVTANGTQPFTYQWYEGGDGNRSKPLGANSEKYETGPLSRVTRFWAEVRNACGAATSSVATVRIQQGNTCVTPDAPRPSVVATATSGAPYVVYWDDVDNATSYEVEEALAASFAGATVVRTEAGAATFHHTVDAPVTYFYRVHALNSCNGRSGDSRVVRIAVVPPRAATRDLIVPYGTKDQILSTITVDVDPMATTFTATASESWITIDPSSGGVPASGRLVLTLLADPRTLPHGTSRASVHVTTSGSSARGVAANGSTSLNIPVSISLVTPIAPAAPASGGEVMIIPAVAHADGNNAKWQSDVRIAHTYPRMIQYLLTFTPSGSGIDSALQTRVSVDANQTVALDDVLARWFGSGTIDAGATGVLEIRTLDAVLGTGKTLATSRLFNVTENGTFGQFIAAVPLAKFMASSAHSSQTLVALSQSDRFRTNLGLVEGSGKPADVLLEVFSAGGLKLFESTLQLKAGEHRQLGSVLAANGVDTTNARVNVSLASAAGSVFTYASVIDNSTGDPSFVPAVDAMSAPAQRYTIAGVANLDTGNGKWQTDVRLYNGGAATVQATAEFFAQGDTAPAATRTIDVEPGQMMVMDDVLQSLFGMQGAGGALRISTATDTALIPAARTYLKRDSGTYGQFIAAATVENTAGVGTDALRILQVEESDRFRTNVGLTEVTGQPATLEISVALPNRKVAAVTQVDLRPNEYRQVNGLLRMMGLDDAYNANVTVRVIGGAGRVMAYGSVIDNDTQDPTYVMAQ